MTEIHKGCIQFTGGDDEQAIRDLCAEHARAIEHMLTTAMSSAMLTLRVLNEFGIPEIRSAFAETLGYTNIPAWAQIQKALCSVQPSSGNIRLQ